MDTLLDNPRLFRYLLSAPQVLRVSPCFFYYVVVRRAFLDHGLDHRRVADYVGALLSHHLHQRRSELEKIGRSVYLVDLVKAMSEADSEEEEFALQAEIGNRALFLTGIFPDWVYHRHTYGRRAVRLEYYEEMGKHYYAVAARRNLARRHELGEVLEFMSLEFHAMRQALNDLVDQHLHVSRRPETIDGLCRQALYRAAN